MYAVISNNEEMVKAILDMGGDPKVKNTDGKKAINLAQKRAIINLLK